MSLAAKRRWFIVVVLTLVGLPVYFVWCYPHFRGGTVTSIGIMMMLPDLKTEALEANITDGPACASVVSFLGSAHIGSDHKCADIGSFIIRYDDGGVDTLHVLPGHNPDRYEFRFDHNLYRVPRDKFYKVLKDAGVDSTKMPATEH